VQDLKALQLASPSQRLNVAEVQIKFVANISHDVRFALDLAAMRSHETFRTRARCGLPGS
jgi:hypothetical protein